VVSAVVFGSTFEADSVRSETTTFGAGGGYSFQYSPTLSASFSGSLRTSELESPALAKTRRENGFTATLTVERLYEVGSVEGSLQRDLTPTASGFLVQRDQAEVRWRHHWQTRLVSRVGFGYVEDQSLGELSRSEDQRRYRLLAELSYRLTEEWSITGAFRRVIREVDTRSDSAISNAVWIALSWRGRPSAFD
jgi:hypothetical protein